MIRKIFEINFKIFMGQINICFYKTKIWELILGSFCGKICLLDFRYRKMRKTVDNRLKRLLKATFIEKEDEILSEAKKQLDEYLIWKRKEFDLPILLVWSDFQKQVWNGLLKLNYWDTISYLDLATNINNKKAVRALANANWANAICIIIPCHRVIANNWNLGWYWWWIPIKEKLLNLEKSNN